MEIVLVYLIQSDAVNIKKIFTGKKPMYIQFQKTDFSCMVTSEIYTQNPCCYFCNEQTRPSPTNRHPRVRAHKVGISL